MATILPTWTPVSLPQNLTAADVSGRIPPLGTSVELWAITWTPVSSGTGDVCVATPAGWLVDKSVEISGGAVTSVAIQGSNGNSSYTALTNAATGTAITAIAAATLVQITENPLWIKPVVTTGTTVTITLIGRVPRE